MRKNCFFIIFIFILSFFLVFVVVVVDGGKSDTVETDEEREN